MSAESMRRMLDGEITASEYVRGVDAEVRNTPERTAAIRVILRRILEENADTLRRLAADD